MSQDVEFREFRSGTSSLSVVPESRAIEKFVVHITEVFDPRLTLCGDTGLLVGVAKSTLAAPVYRKFVYKVVQTMTRHDGNKQLHLLLQKVKGPLNAVDAEWPKLRRVAGTEAHEEEFTPVCRIMCDRLTSETYEGLPWLCGVRSNPNSISYSSYYMCGKAMIWRKFPPKSLKARQI